MQPIATTRRQLFPEAPDDGYLRARRPPRIPFSARAWYWAIGAMMAVCIGLVLLDVVAGWIAAERIHAALGGTDLQFDDDGDPQVFAGTWVGRLEIGAGVAAAVTYLLLRAAIHVPRGRDKRMSWTAYGAQRRLAPRHHSIQGTNLKVFEDGRDRDWTGMLSGALRGGAQVTVGATAWTTGFGKSKERHHIVFAYLQLPSAVAEVFPGCSLTRFLRGISDVELHPSGYDELRFEDISLDDACEIRVHGTNDEVRWRELFDPITLAGLDELYDAQWVHVGRHIVFCAGGSSHRRAPVDTLDTLCLTAAFMYERFLAAASGDVLREQLTSPG